MSMDAARILNDLAKMIKEMKPETDTDAARDLGGVHVVEDLGFDSLDFINLLFQVEEKYGFKIPEPDIDQHQLFKLGKLAGYVAART